MVAALRRLKGFGRRGRAVKLLSKLVLLLVGNSPGQTYHLEKVTTEGKHSVIHHGYCIVLYIFVVIVYLYVVRLILCLKSKGLRRRVTGAPKVHSTTDANPGVDGFGKC
jgi:hypothetical protein